MTQQVKITGIMPVHNVLSGHFPFLECIYLDLKIVDELILMDGGSTDGTLEVVERLASLNPRIRVVKEHFGPSKEWMSIDDAFLRTMKNHTNTEWIMALHADEYFIESELENVVKAIQFAHENGYNSIRHSMRYFHHWSSLSKSDNDHWPVRIFRKNTDLKIQAGIDIFYIDENQISNNGVYSCLLPEYTTKLKAHHIQDIFDVGDLVTHIRHLYYYGQGSIDRIDGLNRLKEKYGIPLDSNDFDIDKIKFEPIIPERAHPNTPEIFLGLIGLTHYQVREEVVDMIAKCEKIKIM